MVPKETTETRIGQRFKKPHPRQRSPFFAATLILTRLFIRNLGQVPEFLNKFVILAVKISYEFLVEVDFWTIFLYFTSFNSFIFHFYYISISFLDYLVFALVSYKLVYYKNDSKNN